MTPLSDAEIEALIKSKKTITREPKPTMRLDQKSFKNSMVVTDEESREFRVFMRRNEAFPENFSIGLQWTPRDRKHLILVRCNGKHGPQKEISGDAPPWHSEFHIHKATEEMIRERKRPESFAEVTSEFTSYAEGLRFFLEYCNIQYSADQFTELTSERFLFDMDGSSDGNP